MSNRLYLVLLVVAVLALTQSCDPPEEKPPNILLIMVDDWESPY